MKFDQITCFSNECFKNENINYNKTLKKNKYNIQFSFCKYLLIIFIIFNQLIYINESASCSSYTTESSCNVNTACKWRITSDITGCVCESSIIQDVVFIMDASGSVGDDAWLIEIEFVKDLIKQAVPSNSSIGIVQFSTSSQIVYHLNWSQNRTNIYKALDLMTYTRGYTYLKDAVINGSNLFINESTNLLHDRLLFIVTDGNPVPERSQSPCALKQTLINNNIDVIIVGVGKEWTSSKIDCLVDDPINDIIAVANFTTSSFNAIRNLSDAFLCPNVLSVELSEVKPVGGPDHNVTFIELYNDGGPIYLDSENITLSGIVNGYISSNDIFFGSSSIWYSNSYLVLFDNNQFIKVDPKCFECFCNKTNNLLCYDAIYIGCGTNSNSKCVFDHRINGKTLNKTNWYQSAYDVQGQNVLINVTYGNDNDWPNIIDGYTYEVTNIDTCDPIHGSCWKPSCTYYGTPGDIPITNCTTNCSVALCQSNGDNNAYCDAQACHCTGDNYFYGYGSTCVLLEAPLTCSVTMYKDSENGNIDTGDVEWSKVSLDLLHSYQIQWFDYQSISTIDQSEINTHFYYITQPTIRLGVQVRTALYYLGYWQYSNWTNCPIITLSPTLQPTFAPTIGVPPIRYCKASLIQGSKRQWKIEWASANTSYPNVATNITFYKLFFYQRINNSNNLLSYIYTRNLNYTQTFDQDTLSLSSPIYIMRVSAVAYDDNYATLVELSTLMEQQATYCEYSSLTPTLTPTKIPTTFPTHVPTKLPTFRPTLSPTYGIITLEYCYIYIVAGTNRQWNITWNPIVPITAPSTWEIAVYQNNQYIIKFADSNTSHYYYFNNFMINGDHDNLTITTAQKFNPNDDTQINLNNFISCHIISHVPTNVPTKLPTTGYPTLFPTRIPTSPPTIFPTNYPTINIRIPSCSVKISPYSENHTLNSFSLTFLYPSFINALPYQPNNISFIIGYNVQNEEETQYFTLSTNKNYQENEQVEARIITTINNINPNSQYYMFVGDRNGKIISSQTICQITTYAPTLSPTNIPSSNPTPLPTYHPPGVYFQLDTCKSFSNTCICPNNSSFNGLFQCDTNQTNIIGFNQLIVSNPQEFTIGKYLSNYPYDLTVYWTFVQLDGPDAANRSHVNQWNGRTIINGGSGSGTFTILFNNIETILNAKYLLLTLSSCTIANNLQNCSLIYPKDVKLILKNSGGTFTTTIRSINNIPDWLWYLLLAGVLGGMLSGYAFYTNRKNRHLNDEANEQNRDAQMLLTEKLPDDMDANAVMLNPLNDPLGGGNMAPSDGVDGQIAHRQQNVEMIHEPAEKLAFRQEFS